MNDYKELIEVLKNAEHIALFGNGAFNTVLVERCYEAADAIEQLVKERDAAVKDFKEALQCDIFIDCYYCKNIMAQKCKNCGAALENWEWRGVTE